MANFDRNFVRRVSPLVHKKTFFCFAVDGSFFHINLFFFLLNVNNNNYYPFCWYLKIKMIKHIYFKDNKKK